MIRHPYTPGAIRKAQAIGLARRKYPGGVVPLSIEAKAERRKLSAGPLSLLDLLTDSAHWSDCGRVQLRGLVTVETMTDLATLSGLAPRTLRKYLATIEGAGFVRWVVRPSRTRPGVLWITDYPAPKRERKAAAAVVDASEAKPVTAATAPGYGAARVSDDPATVWGEGGTVVPGSDSSPYKDRARVSERGESEKNHGGTTAKRGRKSRTPGASFWKGPRKGTGPLFDLTASDLRSAARLDEIHREAVKRGYAVDTEAGRLRVATIAQHAVRKAQNPGGLFLANLRSGRDHAAQIDEDAARALLDERARKIEEREQEQRDEAQSAGGISIGAILAEASWNLDADRGRNVPKADPEEQWRRACDLDARYGGDRFRRRLIDEHRTRGPR